MTRITTLILLLAVAVVTSPVAAQTKTKRAGKAPNFRALPAGLRISKSIKGTDENESFDPLGPAGTSVSLLLFGPAGIIDIDREASKITALADDRGTNLLKALPGDDRGEYYGGPLTNMPIIRRDATMALQEVMGLTWPAAAAKEIILKGNLVVVAGSKTREEALKDFAFKPGPIRLGDEWITLLEAKKSEYDEGFIIRMKFHDDSAYRFKSVEVLNAQGQPIEAETYPGIVSEDYEREGGKVREVELNLRQAPPTPATLRFNFWDDVQRVTVPIDLKFSVGL